MQQIKYIHYLVLIALVSISQTKLPWYDLPMYPFLAIIIAYSIYTLLKWLETLIARSATPAARILPFAFLFVLFLFPYGKTAKRTINPTNSSSLVMDKNDINYFLKQEIDGREN
jgi:hypothetical protein